MPGSFIISDSGVKVFEDWRDNIVIDAGNPVIIWKASLPREKYNEGVVAGLSRLGSENSEDALTWNYFRTMHLNSRLLSSLVHQIASWSGDKAENYFALFWGRNPENAGAVDKNLKSTLDQMEPWGKDGLKQQTEPDLIVRCRSAIIIVESKLGRPGECVNAWGREKPGIPKDYQAFAERLPSRCFVNEWDWERDGVRFYQLMRNWLLANAMAQVSNAVPYLLAVVNDKNLNRRGSSHEEEFDSFKRFLPQEHREAALLLTWQELYRSLVACMQSEDALDQYLMLRAWLENYPTLQLSQ
jgi:hypothetical protein